MAVAPLEAIAPPAIRFVDHTRHQIALRLLPFLFVLYITNYLDRTSVAYAAIGMSRELGFSDRVFGMGAGVFFLSYLALQVPGALLVERWSARRMISATMIAWGSMTALTALVHTPGQLYMARFLLGAAEAGFFPGVIVYLSHWFIQEDRAKAIGNFMSAIPLSLIIGSPIAGWILGHKWFAVEGWRWLFILEGAPAIVMGVVAFFYLTDWPAEAAWLAPAQQQWIMQTLEEEKPSNRLAFKVGQALRSRTVLLLGAASLLDYFVAYIMIFWLPTMLKRQSGLSDVRVGLLGAVPYVVALIAMLVNGWHSDRAPAKALARRGATLYCSSRVAGAICLPSSVLLTVVLFSMICAISAFLPDSGPSQRRPCASRLRQQRLERSTRSPALQASPDLMFLGISGLELVSMTYGFTLMMISAVAGGILMLLIPRMRPANELSVRT